MNHTSGNDTATSRHLKLVAGKADGSPCMDGVLIDDFDAFQAMMGLSGETRRRRRWSLVTLSEQLAFGGRRLRTARLVDVEVFLGQLPTPATRRAVLSDVRCFYRWASARELLDRNPTELVEVPRVPHRMARPLSSDDLTLAIRAAKPRLRTALMLGAFAGCRVSEIAALRRDEVDAARGLLMIRNGKGAKDRVVPLADRLAEQIARTPRRGDGFVIGTTGQNVSNLIREHFEFLHIRHRPHDLRATFATEAARASNGNMVLVQQLCGHASPLTTARYLAWTPEGRDVVNALHRAA